MEKPKYITNPYAYLVLIILPLCCAVITLCFREYYGAIVCFCIALLFGLLLIFLRKQFFLKMIIDENGIRTYYKQAIVKDLNWDKINDAQAISNSRGGCIIFSDKLLHSGKESWKNSKEIFVNMNTDFAIELYKYKNKIPVQIRDLKKLSPFIVEKISK